MFAKKLHWGIPKNTWLFILYSYSLQLKKKGIKDDYLIKSLQECFGSLYLGGFDRLNANSYNPKEH